MERQDGQDGPAWPPDVMMVCSSGGHLAQLHRLEAWWKDRRRTWVTFDTADATSLLDGEDVVWAHHPTTRHVPNLVRNFFLALRTMTANRPSVVVSDGAGVAVPFFVVARMLGIPTVYLEVYDRIDTPTLTGRLCAPMTDLMLVQWDEQVSLYDDAIVVGGLL